MTTDHVRDLVEVTLVNDPDDRRIQSSVDGLGPKKAATVVSAAFVTAVLDRWPNSASLEAIRDWVRDALAKVQSEHKPSQHVAEILIRAILHEDPVIRELPAGEVFRGQIWLTYEIVHGLHTDEASRNRFVDEAVGVANGWLTEG